MDEETITSPLYEIHGIRHLIGALISGRTRTNNCLHLIALTEPVELLAHDWSSNTTRYVYENEYPSHLPDSMTSFRLAGSFTIHLSMNTAFKPEISSSTV